jgi:hypothetical protein
MARSRFVGLVALALLLALAHFQNVWSEEERNADTVSTCVVYSLKDLGSDANLGQWIADTIPQVVMPGTWQQKNGSTKRVLTYYAPAKILVVYHTPEAQIKVATFLRDLKNAMPKERTLAEKLTPDRAVVPAKFTAQNPLPGVEPGVPTIYTVPSQSKPPKHLFHFIIRYEGDGFIDANVVKLYKYLYSEGAGKKDEAAPSASPTPLAPDSPAPSSSTSSATLPQVPSPTAPAAPTNRRLPPPGTAPAYSVHPSAAGASGSFPPSTKAPKAPTAPQP